MGLQTETTSNLLKTPQTGDGYVHGQSATDKIGFYGATPVVQATPAANTTTVAAGSTTAVFTNTTFSGGTGTTAYTVGDLVAILKSLGILKS